MEKAELKKELHRLTTLWAKRLGIADYEYEVQLKTNEEMHNNYAEVDTDDESRSVVIEFNYQKLLKEPKEIETTVIHELLHTRMNEYGDFVIDFINENLDNPKTKRLLQRRIEKLEHKIVVALTNAFTRKGE